MAKVYFDTGALVKLYIVEPGSAFVQNRAQRAGVYQGPPAIRLLVWGW